MKPEEWFCAKVNCLDFVFPTPYIIWVIIWVISLISLAKDFFFMVGFPSCTSNIESKKNEISCHNKVFLDLHQTFLIVQTCYCIQSFALFQC